MTDLGPIATEQLEAKQLWDYYKNRVSFDVLRQALQSLGPEEKPEGITVEGKTFVAEMDLPSTTDERKVEILSELLSRISNRLPT